MRRFLRSLDQSRLAGGASVLAVTQLAASVVGLLRDRTLFGTFPGLGVTDVYFAAFRPSDFLFQACVLSALGTVLVPVLAGYRAHGKQEEMGRVLSATMNLGAVVFGAIALLLAAVFPWVAPFLVQFEGEQLALYIQFGRLALISNFLFVFGSTLGQHLIAVQRYWVYGLTPVLYTVGTILGTLFLTPVAGAWGPMLGTIGGAAIYALLRLIAVLVTGVRLHALFWHPDFVRMGKLMLPRILSLGALQLQLLVFDGLGSGLARGAISINLASRNFQSVVVGVVGIALAQAIYSPLSQAAARSDVRAYTTYLRKALALTLLLTIPAAAVLVMVSPIAAGLVDLSQVLAIFRWSLLFYALSIPFESVNHLLLRGYYALRDTLLPACSTVLAGITAIVVAWLLVDRLDVYALGIAFTAGQLVQTLGLALLLPARLKRMKAAA